MQLTYNAEIPDADIIGRLLGPDMPGGYVQVTGANRAHGKTTVTCRPVGPGELAKLTRDSWGQLWLPLPELVN